MGEEVRWAGRAKTSDTKWDAPEEMFGWDRKIRKKNSRPVGPKPVRCPKMWRPGAHPSTDMGKVRAQIRSDPDRPG